MSKEYDRRFMPELVQNAFTMSLGFMYVGVEMIKSPQQSAGRVFSEMKDLLTIPSEAGPGLSGKAGALAKVWMEKGTAWMEECKTAGSRFTQDLKYGDVPPVSVFVPFSAQRIGHIGHTTDLT